MPRTETSKKKKKKEKRNPHAFPPAEAKTRGAGFWRLALCVRWGWHAMGWTDGWADVWMNSAAVQRAAAYTGRALSFRESGERG